MPRTTAPDALLDDPHLTTMGLFVETHAGLVALDTTHGLSAPWFEVLLRLARTPGRRLRMSDLAAQTTLSASGLTRLVDRLVAEGLVERAACPSDRRGSFAVLTSAGETRLGRALPEHVAALTDVFERAFTPEELATFVALMRRLRDTVNPAAERASRAREDC